MNTINNVPRELLEEVMLAAQRMPVRGPSIRAKLHALLSAPSPAGVDGLEVAAYLIGGEPSLTPCLVRGVVNDPLCRLSDAQAIIDGLRGEVAALQADGPVTVSAHSMKEFRQQRDQQAQRIGELEAELARITGLWELELGRAQKAEAGLFNAALSAGKEGE